MTPSIDVRDLVVERAGAAICTVSHLEVAPEARLGLIGLDLSRFLKGRGLDV